MTDVTATDKCKSSTTLSHELTWPCYAGRYNPELQ